MNTGSKLITILIITIEISFTSNSTQDLIILAGSLIYLGFDKVRFQTIANLLLVPVIPAASLAGSQLLYGSHAAAILLPLRTYAYVELGADLTLTTSRLKFAAALEQNFHLSSKFVYGITGTLGSIVHFEQQLRLIKAAGRMRGLNFHFWSPQIYFRAVADAVTDADQITAAMRSHGFSGNGRTHLISARLTTRDWLIGLTILITIQIPLLV